MRQFQDTSFMSEGVIRETQTTGVTKTRMLEGILTSETTGSANSEHNLAVHVHMYYLTLMTHLSQFILPDRSGWSEIFKALREKNHQLRILSETTPQK